MADYKTSDLPLFAKATGQIEVEDPDTPGVYGKYPFENLVKQEFILPGCVENKNHVAKVDNTHFSVTAGSGWMRKDDGSLHLISWDAISSIETTIVAGELRWIVWQWLDQGAGTFQIQLIENHDPVLENFEKYLPIGRLWKNAATPPGEPVDYLVVSGRHLKLSNVAGAYEAGLAHWGKKAYNITQGITYGTDKNLLKITTGELFRWPISDLTGRHVFNWAGVDGLSYTWRHLRGQAAYTTVSDNSAGDGTDIRKIADYYDLNGVLTLVPANNFVVHKFQIWAVSWETTLVTGQAVFATLDDALNSIGQESTVYSPWLGNSDTFRQAALVGYIVLKRGTIDFSNAANARFVITKAI